MRFSEFKRDIDTLKSEMQGNDESRRKLKNLDTILNVVKSINRSLILNDVLKLVLTSAIRLTNSDKGFIVLENEYGQLEFKLGLNSDGNSLSKSLFQVSTTVVEEVFHSGRSKFIEDAQSDQAIDKSKSIIRLDLSTILCSPLMTGDKKLGVIYVDSQKLQRIQLKEITDTFEILAGQAAIAINNAQLYNAKIKALKALQEANEQLRKAKDEAEKSNRLKTEFLAQMSHEIRTPINIIFGFTSLLREELNNRLPEEQKETFDIISGAGQRIMRTIDSILEMSQLQSGSYDFAPGDLDLDKDIFHDLLKSFRHKAREKELSIYFEDKCPDKTVFADKYMVNQIFSKLLDNAVKYTNKGEIRVTVEANEKNNVEVHISDTGIGISEHYLDNLYTPFSQEETGYTRAFEGNGLGLAIARKYVELNNASIDVKSKKGEGSTFIITFPA